MAKPKCRLACREPKAVRNNQLLTETVMPTIYGRSQNIFSLALGRIYRHIFRFFGKYQESISDFISFEIEKKPILSFKFEFLRKVWSIMGRLRHPLTPSLAKIAEGLGQRIELARCRRDLSATLFAERVGIDPKTLARLEAGDASVSLGSYLKALRVLRLEDDLVQVAANDILGQKLQDASALRSRGRKTDGV